MLITPARLSTGGWGVGVGTRGYKRRGGCGRIGYTGPTGRTGPGPDPSDSTAYRTYTSLAQLLASSSLLVEVYPSF